MKRAKSLIISVRNSIIKRVTSNTFKNIKLNEMKKIIILFSLIALFTACEDVIEIDLKNIEPKIVIAGAINDLENECTVRISKTVDYFKPGTYPPVTNATVLVSDNLGNTFNFEEKENGKYTSVDFKANENTSYTLNVNIENKVYEADVTLPEKVEISYLTSEETPLYMEFDGGYIVNCHLTDPLEEENYYRLKAYNINDAEKAGDSKYLFNDDLTEGKLILMQWDVEQYELNDTVVVELQTLDKSTYQYYNTLFLLGDNIFGSSNPANPKTNLNNDAMGLFAAYTISRDTIIIKQ